MPAVGTAQRAVGNGDGMEMKAGNLHQPRRAPRCGFFTFDCRIL
jgi:hypothetical protein